MATEMVLNNVKLALSDFCKYGTLKGRRKKAYLLSTLNSAKNSPSYDSELINGLERELQTLVNDSAGILTKKKEISNSGSN